MNTGVKTAIGNKPNITVVGYVVFFCIVLSSLAVPSSVFGDETEYRRYKLPGHGYLTMKIPAGWEDEVSYPQGDLPPSIRFSSGSEGGVIMLVTPLWSFDNSRSAFEKEHVRGLLDKDAQELIGQAEESEYVIHELDGPNAEVLYFSLTDSNPGPGGYRYVTRAGAGVGGLLLSVTILYNEKENGEYKNALEAVRLSSQEKDN